MKYKKQLREEKSKRLRIYSGIFEAKRSTLELPIMTLDMSIMSNPKTINGIATVVHDFGCGNILKSKFRSTDNNFSRIKDGSFLINCTGYPLSSNEGLPRLDSYCNEVLDINPKLPNLKMLLRIDPSWKHGMVTYKFRTSCDAKWINVAQVPVNLSQDGLKRIA